MTTAHTPVTPAALKTPRAAAVAGILIALLYGASLVLIRVSVPPKLAAESGWLETNGGRVALALILLLIISYNLWVTLIFPAWVLAMSLLFLITEKRS